jgi:hypothetical protein
MSKVNLSVFYGWLLLLVMLTNVAALSYFVENFLRVSRARAALVAGAFYAAWLASVSSPGDSVYWLTVAIEYQLSISTLLIVAGLLCKSRHSVFSYVALAVLAIAIPGQHEIAGVFLLICLLMGVVAARVLKLETRQWLLGLGLAAISLAVAMFGPGMSSKLTGRQVWDVTHILPYAKRAAEHGVNWVVTPAVLLCAVCMPLLLWSGEDSSAGSEHRPPRWLALAGLGAMFALLGEFAFAELASGYGLLPPSSLW